MRKANQNLSMMAMMMHMCRMCMMTRAQNAAPPRFTAI